jgi:hypothetical protein
MRPISNIARDIKKTWVDKNGRSNVWFGAVPYLDAMFSLSNISDNYGADSGKSIVRMS